MENKRHMPLDAGLKRIAHVLENYVLLFFPQSQIKKGSIVIGSMTSHQIVRLPQFMRNSV